MTATPEGAAAHNVDGDTVNRQPPATIVPACQTAVHNVDSSWCHQRASDLYARVRTIKLNQNPRPERTGQEAAS